jgi:hypothetical protein
MEQAFALFIYSKNIKSLSPTAYSNTFLAEPKKDESKVSFPSIFDKVVINVAPEH